ncbi:MAG: hypothetical protein ABI155_01440 [Paralcaligenes sp.]
MSAHASNTLRPILYTLGLALTTLILAGCAQLRTPGYYDVQHDSTQSDAQAQAQGRDQTKAPSQVQLSFGNSRKGGQNDQAGTASPAALAAAPAATPALAEAKTFLGTIPCLVNGNACSATRVTLTLAPNREWRARTLTLDGANANHSQVQQGCWSVIGTSPLRILLQLTNQNTKADLSFINNDQLHINTIDNITPNLDYRLTRQADIDAISELNKSQATSCGK